MHRQPKPYSKGKNVRTSRISRLRPRVVPNAPQLLPDNGTHYPSSFPPMENPIDETQDPSFLPPMWQTHNSHLNMTELRKGGHGSSPPFPPTENLNHDNGPNMASLASSSSPFPSETNSSPPVSGPRSGDLNINGPTSELPSSSLPPPAQPRGNPATSTIFPGAHDFVINNFRQNPDTVFQGMKALSERVIKGAEYDSSLRDPPPQCHPGTRVELVGKILAWFRNGGREKALLWLSGPAGVGKSAVIQTVAESIVDSDNLIESKSIGATLFFSRLNNRSDPQRVFITLAFQLATRIPAYQIYITGRIALDPSLLEKGMKEQFRIFVTEPFGSNGIGKGEGPWVVLLDGLDECEGVEEQSRIVRLVSDFVLRFPNAPLIWIIASRPEPHIVATFKNKAVAPGHWSEYVPINSTQSCRDVEHYLDKSFKAMQEQFPHLPPNWPRQSQFLKLSSGARGLFVFARTAVRFMEDPNYASPVSRLDLLISVIDRLDIKIIDGHPFALLDALYTQILTSIPFSVWCTTKRLLGFAICVQPNKSAPRPSFPNGSKDGLSLILESESCSLMGASVILGLELSVTYGSLHKLHSVLDIPDSEEAHWFAITFLHASFGDYLTDKARSKDFYIDCGEVVDDIAHDLFQLYLDKPWITEWERYTPQLSSIEGTSLYTALREDAGSSIDYVLTGTLRSKRGRGPFKSWQDRSDCMDAWSRINLAEDFKFVHGTVAAFLIELWDTFREELESTRQFTEVPLWDLTVDHLRHKRNCPTFIHEFGYSINSSLARFERMKSELQVNLISHPGRRVMICGSLPENRISFFAGRYTTMEGYFCFPYPY